MNGEEQKNSTSPKEEQKQPSIFDDDIETLDDEDTNPNASTEIDTSGGGFEGEYDERRRSSSNNSRNNIRPDNDYHSRQYYKDQVKETGERRDSAKEDFDKAREQRNEAKQKFKDAKTGEDKEAKKAAKDQYKAAKKADKQAKSDFKEARSANRHAKFDQASDMANRVAHPVDTGKSFLKNKINEVNPMNKVGGKINEKRDAITNNIKSKLKNGANKAGDAAKEGAKKAGHAAKEGAKKAGHAAKEGAKKAGQAAAKGGKAAIEGIAKLISSLPPPVLIGILIVLLLVIAAMIIMVVLDDDDDEALMGLSATTCTYENMGGVSDDTTVVITACDSDEIVEYVPLEKYIAGVVINKLGEDANEEVMKAGLIIERSKLLAAAKYNTGNMYDQKEDYIKVSQCSDDYYWDYTKSIYKSDGTNPIYSTDESSGYPLWKSALVADDIIKFENTAKQVACMYLTDSSGNVVNTDISLDNLEELINQAKENEGSDNGSYTALLLQNVDDAGGISSGQTNNASYFSADVGEYSGWKQLCSLNAPWCNVCMNKKCTVKVDSFGCGLVSIAMLIAHSGVDTSNIPNFNPGTFTDAMRNSGYLGSGGGIKSWGYVTKLVPNFDYHKTVRGVKGDISKVKQYADQGYYIVLEVKGHSNSNGNEHYVAVDNAASAAAGWKDVYIWDPARNINHLSEKKNGYSYRANKMIIYEVKR